MENLVLNNRLLSQSIRTNISPLNQTEVHHANRKYP